MDAFFYGTILPWPVGYPPQGWMYCRGQSLQIQRYAALYSLIGTKYGGNGTTTFNLPNLSGNFPVGATTIGTVGVASGAPTVTSNQMAVLTANQVPPHTHTATGTVTGLTGTTSITASTANTGGAMVPADQCSLCGTGGTGFTGNPSAAIYLDKSVTPTKPVNLGGVQSQISGGEVTLQLNNTNTPAPFGTPVTLPSVPPYLTCDFIICVDDGIYPNFN